MKIVLDKIKKLIQKVAGYFPTSLPQGIVEFDAWSESIIDLYDMPKNDSVKWSLAIMIMHLDATSAYKPKYYFGKALRKSAANQVAAQVVQDLKTKQAEQQALALKQQAEATAVTAASSEPQG